MSHLNILKKSILTLAKVTVNLMRGTAHGLLSILLVPQLRCTPEK